MRKRRPIQADLEKYILAMDHGHRFTVYDVETWGECSLSSAQIVVDRVRKNLFVSVIEVGKGGAPTQYQRIKIE